MEETTKFEDLTIQSNFMFKHVMGNKNLCQYFISNVMQCEVVDLEYIETEKELEPYFDSKCVRLDVIVVDKNNNRYNLEMQVRNVLGKDTKLPLLPKRARYYQSVMDMDMLQKGQSYDQLSPLVLVFVCAFDLFNEGRYVYTFKSRCLENLDLELGNDVTTMFLNANGVAGAVTPQMVNFLEYVRTQVPNDAYTHELEAEVVRLKQDKVICIYCNNFRIILSFLHSAELSSHFRQRLRRLLPQRNIRLRPQRQGVPLREQDLPLRTLFLRDSRTNR